MVPSPVKVTGRELVIVIVPADNNVPPLKTSGLDVEPKAAVALALTIPEVMVTPVVKVFVALSVNCEAPFWTTPVTLVLIIPLISTVPEPDPEFVTVPELLIEGLAVEIVIPEVRELSLSSVRFPVPVIPPETVSILVPNTF
jgi:hypothetical protein